MHAPRRSGNFADVWTYIQVLSPRKKNKKEQWRKQADFNIFPSGVDQRCKAQFFFQPHCGVADNRTLDFVGLHTIKPLPISMTARRLGALVELDGSLEAQVSL